MMERQRLQLQKGSKIVCILFSITLMVVITPVQNVDANTKQEIETSTSDSYLPKTKEAEEVIVLDLSHDLKNKDGEAKEAYMAITSIQGIINRESTSKIYLTHTPQEHDWTPFAADESYLENGLIPVEKKYPILDYGKKYPVLSYLLEKYHKEVSGIMQVPQLSGSIIDGAIMAGVTAAGVEDAILVSEGIEKYIEQEGYTFEVKGNTRNLKSNIEAFDWAYNNYFDKCTKTYAAQHTFTAFGGGMDDQFPIMYDYYIATKAFVFCLDGNKPEELLKLQSFLVPENYAPGTAILGLPVDEGKGISCMQDEGYYFAIMYVPNLTVTSSFPYDSKSVSEPVEPTALQADNNTNYVAFFATDGDSMGFPTNFMYDHMTTSNTRGEVPIGWSFNPHLIDLFPTLVSYYSNNDYNSFYELVSSMNNGGSPKGEEASKTFRERYVDYMGKSNEMFRTINYFNEDAYVNDLTAAIKPYLLINGYQGQTNGNDVEWGSVDGTDITYTNMSGATQGNAKTEHIYQALNRITTTKPDNKPTFTIICVGDGRWSEDPTLHVSEAIEKLKADNPNQDFTFLRPTDLAATYKAYNGDESVTIGDPKKVTLENTNTVDKVVVDKEAVEIIEGNETSIKGFAMDSEGQYISNKIMTYESEDESIATVDTLGNIKGIKEGKTNIKISIDNKSAFVEVSVIGRKATSIAVDKSIFSTAIGGQTTVNPNLYNQYGQLLPTPTFTWESSNEDIVTVKGGVITGVGKGDAEVTVSYESLKTTITVSVLESTASISKIVIDPSYLEMFESDIYNVKVNAYDENNHEVFGFTPTWSISDQGIASIDSDGYVTGLTPGQTKITASFGEQANQSIDLLIKEDNRNKLLFENIGNGDFLGTVDDIITFENNAFQGYGKQGEIQGNAIKLAGGNYEKAFHFKDKTILKSVKAHNPTNETITLTLVGEGATSYRIDPGKTLTLKTNWQTENTNHVIKTTNTAIAFGEFVYGEADSIPTTLDIDQGDDQISIATNGTLALSATLYDQNNKEMIPDYIEWSTDRDDIVKVDENGRITGVAVGSTFIYAKSHGLVASILVYVTDSEVDRIEVSPKSLVYYVGDSIPLQATAYDKDNQELHYPTIFTSGDEDVVSIESNNYVKAVGTGTTQVTVNVSGIETSILVYVKEHSASDQIIDFTEFSDGDYASIVDDRVTFEEGFWQVKSNVPGIQGNAIHLKDENTGEKAFYFNPASTIKSFKVHNPTNAERKVVIKTLDNSLEKVEHMLSPGETRTIYTGYTGQATGYAIETYYQVLVGEIVYTDTLETGFTCEDIANGITSLRNPKNGQSTIELPVVEGYNISISESSHPDVIAIDGTLDPLGIEQEVSLVLKVTPMNETFAAEEAYTKKLAVTITGLPADKAELTNTISKANQQDLSLYKPSTVEIFNTALDNANDAVNNLALRQREVDDIVQKLDAAINQLATKANKDELEKILGEIQDMDMSTYTPATIAALNIIIEQATNIINDEECSQQTVDDIVLELTRGVENLLEKADISELEELYTKIKNMDLTVYTKESVDALTTKLEEIKLILDNPNVSQSDVDKALSELKTLHQQLQLKSTITPKENAQSNQNQVKSGDDTSL
ncbi:MAG: Ig-like domain-containing protein, partial [Coprobacillaceae bacterium]